MLIAGGGPAGRALAGACAALGLRTVLIDPEPDRPWRATYGSWADELPAGLPDAVVGACAPARAIARTSHDLGWGYAVLNTAALREHLDAGLRGLAIHRGRVVGVSGGRITRPAGETANRGGLVGPRGGPTVVQLADGSLLDARVAVDATGAGGLGCAGSRQSRPPDGRGCAGHGQVPAGRATSSSGPAASPPGGRRQAAEQTAYGVVVPAEVAAPLVRPGTAMFMDWRAEHGARGWPSFLYGVPYGDGTVLLEETSLARRPGLPLAELRRRLHARLAVHGIRPPGDAPAERVRFPLDLPPARVRPAFGAATPLTHPATGFSVATALRLAPAVAAALTGDDPQRAAERLLWPPAARVVHALRVRGLAALLVLPPEQVPDFFEAFFGLPPRHRRSYLTARTDPVAVAAAMAALYRRAGWPVRARLTAAAFGIRG